MVALAGFFGLGQSQCVDSLQGTLSFPGREGEWAGKEDYDARERWERKCTLVAAQGLGRSITATTLRTLGYAADSVLLPFRLPARRRAGSALPSPRRRHHRHSAQVDLVFGDAHMWGEGGRHRQGDGQAGIACNDARACVCVCVCV